jgi:hypothetical protein
MKMRMRMHFTAPHLGNTKPTSNADEAHTDTKAWKHLSFSRSGGGSVSSKVEPIDLNTPEPTCWLNVSTTPIIDLETLGTHEPGQLPFNSGQPVSVCKPGCPETNRRRNFPNIDFDGIKQWRARGRVIRQETCGDTCALITIVPCDSTPQDFRETSDPYTGYSE